MRRMIPLSVLLFAGAGCSREPATEPAPVQRPPQPRQPAPDPWITEGQTGDLTFIRQEETVASARMLRAAAIFGGDRTGLLWPAACEFADRLCLPDDAPLEEPIDARDLRLPESEGYAWVGDRLDLGDFEATFDVKPDTGVAGYRGRQVASGLVLPSYPLSFQDGEWGDFERDELIPLPDRMEGLSPPVWDPVEVGDAPYQRFRWRPTAGAQMVLSVRGNGWGYSRLLENDGEVFVDTSELRDAEPVDVRLFRVEDAGEVEIGGNTLALTTVAEQGWCMYRTCDGEPIGDVVTDLTFEFCWSASSCGTSKFILDPDGSWSTLEGYIGSWTFDCCTRQLDVYFSSGTHYSAVETEPDCFEGEMISWSGNQGDWSGCL